MALTATLTGLRAELADRRRARANHRVLEEQLASYVGAAEVDDLLASLSDLDGPEAEQIRSILVRKLAHSAPKVFAA